MTNLMNATFIVVSVAIALVVAIAIISNLASSLPNELQTCPTASGSDPALKQNLAKGCSIFNSMGGLLIIIVPILAVAAIIMLYLVRGGF